MYEVSTSSGSGRAHAGTIPMRAITLMPWFAACFMISSLCHQS
ncbi:MAG: hypothetical protein M5R40_20880 [Anaerolineae bacterium]|nr:hypothetical protein [Anaerolineae bacterium]